MKRLDFINNLIQRRRHGHSDWEAVRNDVKNFLENPGDVQALTPASLRPLLAG